MTFFKIDLSPEVVRQISIERAMGASLNSLVDTFKVSKTVLNRVLEMDVSKAIVDDTRGKAQRAAVAYLRSEMCRLVDKTVKVIEKALDDGNLKAVPLVYTALGLEARSDNGVTTQQAIQVILPGRVDAKEIEIKKE